MARHMNLLALMKDTNALTKGFDPDCGECPLTADQIIEVMGNAAYTLPPTVYVVETPGKWTYIGRGATFLKGLVDLYNSPKWHDLLRSSQYYIENREIPVEVIDTARLKGDSTLIDLYKMIG